MVAKLFDQDIARSMARTPKDKTWKRRAFTIGKYQKSKPKLLNFGGNEKNKQIKTDILRSHSQMLRK